MAVLWSFNVGSGVYSAPVTFKVGGKQYVAVAVGRSATIPLFLSEVGGAIIRETPEAGMLFVFSL